MQKSKKNFQCIAKGSYTAFRRFISDNLKQVDENDVIHVYTTCDTKKAVAILKKVEPSSKRVGHALCKYQPQRVISLWGKTWGISENIAIAVLRDGSDTEAHKLITALSQKISVETEIAMLERGDVTLLKLWLKKFGTLETDSEIALNDNPKMSTLLRYYLEQS